MPRPDPTAPFTLSGSGLDMSMALSLARKRTAAGAARHAVVERFDGLLADDVLRDAAVVISELVTNALIHGRGDIRLHVTFDGQRMIGEVSDQGPGFAPPPRSSDRGKVGGQGLYVVGRLADAWGVRTKPTRVWFELLARRPAEPGREAGPHA